MGNVYFKVLTKTKDPKKKVSIRLRYKDGIIDQSTATGEKIQLQHWDLEKQSFKRTNFPGKDNMIAKLKKMEAFVLDKAGKAKQIETGWLFETIDRYLHPDKYKNQGKESMYKWIENWIEKSQNCYRVVRTYHTTLDALKTVDPELEWDKVDLEFYDDFVAYLTDKGYAKNSVGTHVKNLKVFCNAAHQRNVHTNIAYNNFKKPAEESFNIYLNEEELYKISALDLSESPYLDRVRDIFLIGCWTGLRFSDLHKVNEGNTNGQYIHLEQQKTQGRVIIPLHPVVKSILTKYNGVLPNIISNQKFNTYIKIVCKKAELTDKITKSITKGRNRKTEVYEKWELVASHTARRSFATNLYKSGFPSISIMAITGHKTEKAFLSYIKVNEEEHAEMLAKHWNKLNNDK